MGNTPQSPLKAFQDYRLASSTRGNLTTTLTHPDQPPLTLTYAFASQRGSTSKGGVRRTNKDSVLLRPHFLGRPNMALFGLFDGHGKEGAKLSALIRDHVEAALGRELTKLLAATATSGGTDYAAFCGNDEQAEKVADALQAAFIQANELVESHDSTVDESFSGACAIVLLFVGRRVFCANAGTSRAILARGLAQPQAASLSSTHTPARPDERARIIAAGGRVMNYTRFDQLQSGAITAEQAAQEEEEEEEGGDPLRVWDGQQSKPGCLFTRSIGDSYAKRLGVCADPEVCIHLLDEQQQQDSLICLATRGVFQVGGELADNPQHLVDMVHACDKPMDACKLVGDYHMNQRKKEAAEGGGGDGAVAVGDGTTLLCIFLKEVAAGDDVAAATTDGSDGKGAEDTAPPPAATGEEEEEEEDCALVFKKAT